MKYFFLSYLFVAAIVVAAFGTRGSKSELPPLEIFQDMDHQAKVKYQTKSDFFADGLGARRPVKGTVPMGFEVPAAAASSGKYQPPAFGFSHGVGYYGTGKIGDYYGDGLPKEIELSKSLLERGERQYNIYCAVCHEACRRQVGLHRFQACLERGAGQFPAVAQGAQPCRFLTHCCPPGLTGRGAARAACARRASRRAPPVPA